MASKSSSPSQSLVQTSAQPSSDHTLQQDKLDGEEQCDCQKASQTSGDLAARAFGSGSGITTIQNGQDTGGECGCNAPPTQQEIPLSSVISGGCACMQAAPQHSSGTVCNPDLCDCNDDSAVNDNGQNKPSASGKTSDNAGQITGNEHGKHVADPFSVPSCGCSSGAGASTGNGLTHTTPTQSDHTKPDSTESAPAQSGAMAASLFGGNAPSGAAPQGSLANQAFSAQGTTGHNLSDFSGGCACSQEKQQAEPPRRSPTVYAIIGTLLLGFWFALYWQLHPLAQALTNALPIEKGSHLFEAVAFFLYDTPKVLMLLSLVVFGVGVLRTWVTPERTRKYLAGRRESVGNVLAALLGVVTPFCSCSAVPLFLGFVAAGVPLGVTFSFLIAAPMVNEIALVLLYGLFGFKVAAIYFATGVTIAIIAGWILGRMNLEHMLESWVKQVRDDGVNNGPRFTSFLDRVDFGLASVRDIVGKTWKYVLVGIAAGAAIHGYVPEGFMAGIMGREAWWSVPAAVVLGIPMYANAAGIIPVVSALLGKGAAMGTVLAFMMSVVALSFPEMVILRKVLSVRLIALFVGIVGLGILCVGYLFNMIM